MSTDLATGPWPYHVTSHLANLVSLFSPKLDNLIPDTKLDNLIPDTKPLFLRFTSTETFFPLPPLGNTLP